MNTPHAVAALTCRITEERSPDSRWKRHAACHNHPLVHPESWWPARKEKNTTSTQCALRVCWKECPVRAECADDAFLNDETGGFLPWERTPPPEKW